MDAAAVQTLISSRLGADHIEVQGEGSKFHVTVVSSVFEGLNSVKKQQQIYACLSEEISSGAVHAVTMSLFTPTEWAAK